MRVLDILVSLVGILPTVFSVSIPPPESLCKPGAQRTPGQCTEQDCVVQLCAQSSDRAIIRAPFVSRNDDPSQEHLPTEICDEIGEERCLGNEWRLECSAEHRWEAFEECPKHGQCCALENKTFCSAEGSSTLPPSPPSTLPPEPCHGVGKYRCAKWSNGIHRIDMCDHDLFWISIYTCSPGEFCMYWVPGKELSSGQAKCTFIIDLPPTRPSQRNLASRSRISQGTPDILEHCTTVGETRCNGKQVEMCSAENAWINFKSCSDTEECRAEYYDARCQPIVASKLFTRRSPTVDSKWCRTGESRCLGTVLELCEQNKWKPTMCPSPSKCVKRNDVVQCWVEPPYPSGVPELCVSGDRKCDSDAYALQLCGEDEMYHTEKKCATPGDCKTDGPGQAHCETGNMDPPKFERRTNSTQCTHGDYACDTHRRFMFKCDKNNTWQEPIQCHRAGACQPVEPTAEYPKGSIDCIGFPKYLYPDDRVCETFSSCEFMRYMYCSAGSRKPEDMEKCRASMCMDRDCKDCDRCTYRLGYGEVLEPDLSTLIHGSPTQ